MHTTKSLPLKGLAVGGEVSASPGVRGWERSVMGRQGQGRWELGHPEGGGGESGGALGKAGCVCVCFPTGDLGFSSLGLAISYYLSTCLLGSKISCLLPSPHLLLFFKLMSFLTLCCHFKGLEVTVQLDRMSSVWLCFSIC